MIVIVTSSIGCALAMDQKPFNMQSNPLDASYVTTLILLAGGLKHKRTLMGQQICS